MIAAMFHVEHGVMDIENAKALHGLRHRGSITAAQADQCEIYVNLLETWTHRTRLISRNDRIRIVSRHLTDSLGFCRPEILPDEGRVMDLGSGAGFPGLVIKIMAPRLHVTLVESRRMKALFLREVVEHLALTDIQVLERRVETLRAGIDVPLLDRVVARCVGPLPLLWSWSRPLLHATGMLAAQKGGEMSRELEQTAATCVSILPLRSHVNIYLLRP